MERNINGNRKQAIIVPLEIAAAMLQGVAAPVELSYRPLTDHLDLNVWQLLLEVLVGF